MFKICISALSEQYDSQTSLIINQRQEQTITLMDPAVNVRACIYRFTYYCVFLCVCFYLNCALGLCSAHSLHISFAKAVKSLAEKQALTPLLNRTTDNIMAELNELKFHSRIITLLFSFSIPCSK